MCYSCIQYICTVFTCNPNQSAKHTYLSKDKDLIALGLFLSCNRKYVVLRQKSVFAEIIFAAKE